MALIPDQVAMIAIFACCTTHCDYLGGNIFAFTCARPVCAWRFACASLTIGGVGRNSVPRKLRVIRFLFAVRQRRRQRNGLTWGDDKFAPVRLVRRLWISHVMKRTYAPDAAGSVAW